MVVLYIRRSLGWKLFFSYLLVILVGIVVLATAAELAIPPAFDRHMAAMSQTMGATDQALELDLFANFRRAVGEAFFLAASATFVAAVILSALVSRRIVSPVEEMQSASQRIADGHYAERVGVPGNVGGQALDELSRLAVSFNRMAAQLEQIETVRRDLIGNVAHELRTPLSSIKGYMEGLIDGVLPADIATFQLVHGEAERLERLVRDLQELSRVEAAAMELKVKPVPVAHMVHLAVDRLGRQFEEKGVGLDTDVPADLPAVLADEDRIGQVLLNLVGNALQYTPSEGRVWIRARREGGCVRVAVEDSGMGIASEHLPHIFERFYRVDKSRSRAGGGSGIGLTIAKHLVEAHGGSIQAASPGIGLGSTFTFTVPIA